MSRKGLGEDRWRLLSAEEDRRFARISRPVSADDAALALESEDAELVAIYLRQHPVPDRVITLRLAELLDPYSKAEELQLTFKRRKAGNSRSALTALIQRVALGIAARDEYEKRLARGDPRRGLVKLVVGEIAQKNGVSDRLVHQGMKEIRATRPASQKPRA